MRDLGFAHPRRLQDSDASESLCFWLVFKPRSERSHVQLRKSS